MHEPSSGGPDDSGPALKGKARHEWETSLLRSVAKPGPNHVLHALLRYAGGKHECWPSNESLSRETGLSERWIRRVLGELVEANVVATIPDRSLKTQRRIVIVGHPNAIREGFQAPPPLNAGGALCVGAGGASRPPETKRETKGGEESSGREGSRGETASDALWRNLPNPIACVDPMRPGEATDCESVMGWARAAWLAIAPGRSCEAVDDLVRIAAARDDARLGFGSAEIVARRRWVEAAIESMRAPAWPGDGGRR